MKTNREFAEEMKRRTKAFAVRIIKAAEALPDRRAAWGIGRQLLRAGTSVGANYRAACRARSKAEFRAKLGIVEEEADECLYWMEVLVEAGLMKMKRLTELMREADEILGIVVSAINKTPHETASTAASASRKLNKRNVES